MAKRYVSDLITKRNNELTDTFLRNLGKGLTVKQAMAHAAAMPASRFWIEPDNALRIIRAIQQNHWGKRGKELPMLKAKINEIMRRCNGDFSPENIDRVIFSPAPCFYLCPRTAQNIIFRTLKQRQCKK